jgi:hypothetical protein
VTPESVSTELAENKLVKTDTVVVHETVFTLIFCSPGAIQGLIPGHFPNKREAESYWRNILWCFHRDRAEIPKLRVFYGSVLQDQNLGRVSDSQLLERLTNAVADGRIEAYGLRNRNKSFLDGYLEPVSKKAAKYDVDPILVLGIGGESGFASTGTYTRTHDAFDMTGGSTEHMTTASGPSENVNQFFHNYGEQIRGAKSDMNVFLNGLKGKDALGKPVKGWKDYNPKNPLWRKAREDNIRQMMRDVPIYRHLRLLPGEKYQK